MPVPFRSVSKTHNLQIAEVIDAIAQTEPDLFGEGSATLMPVKHSASLDIPICNAHVANWTPYDDLPKERE